MTSDVFFTSQNGFKYDMADGAPPRTALGELVALPRYVLREGVKDSTGRKNRKRNGNGAGGEGKGQG